MTHQSHLNSTTPYWLSQAFEDNVIQLEETVAFSSLVEPVAHTITLWADPGTGVYPLTTERGGTETTSIVVVPETGQISAVDNIQFTDQSPGTDGLHMEGSDLYFGTIDLSTGVGSGDVAGPGSSADNEIPRYSSTTGKVIKNSGVQLVTSSTAVLLNLNGQSSGFISGSAVRNTGIGAGALSAITTASDNCCFGSSAGVAITTSPYNILVGQFSGANLTTGTTGGNTALGHSSLWQVVTGTYNVCLGHTSGSNYTTNESNNICIGAGVTGTIADSGVIRIGGAPQTTCFVSGISGVTPAGTPQMVTIGTGGQLGSQTIPAGNVVGPASAADTEIVVYNSTTGKIIKNSGYLLNTGVSQSIAITDSASGALAMTGFRNTFFGNFAANQITSGHDNTGFGCAVFGDMTTGANNSTLGCLSMDSLTTGGNNCGIGYKIMNTVTTGSSNIAIGYQSALHLITGSSNIIIGASAGGAYTGAESSNILIGNNGVIGESSIIRIGTSHTSCFVAGISGVTPAGTPQLVTIGTGGQLGSVAAIKNNITAAAPGISDDSASGYAIYSTWINNTVAVTPDIYICSDASVGAAIWTKLN